MKNLIIFNFIALVTMQGVAQVQHQIGKASHSKRTSTNSFNADLKPFYHGVASGDPGTNSVWIWTRITPNAGQNSIELDWVISTQPEIDKVTSLMGQPIGFFAKGKVTALAENDYTVKVNVTGLEPNTTYYYFFSDGYSNSLIGRTKTLPKGDENHLRFAVVSCSNYEAGYFNAYGRIAERNDLDAVIHLGDYIYEYPTGYYGDSALAATGKRAYPNRETITLEEYRARYSLYRLDEDLIRAHQQHPFICIWDDHESANDAYKDGAENHDPSTEGSWKERVSASKKAYFEWIPIAEASDSSIFRTFNFGNLADLIMLDTRLEGREEQINDVTNPALYNPTRTLLGQPQYAWFTDELFNSKATWKIVGNQVIFSEFHVGWAAQGGQTPIDVENIFLDIWDGYPAERSNIIQHIKSNNINNTVFLTGDFHSTFAFDVADSVTDAANFYAPTPNYNPQTGQGSVAVEFATPSITSANFDENLDATTATLFEIQINNPLPGTTQNIPNPHMKKVDLDQHGYFVLDVKPDSTQADYYYMDKINEPSTFQSYGGGVKTMKNGNHLMATQTSASPKTKQALPAPLTPPLLGTSLKEEQSVVHVISVFPNPVNDVLLAQIGVEKNTRFTISLMAPNGIITRVLEKDFTRGVFDLKIDVSNLPSGIYFLSVYNDEFEFSKKVVVK